MKKFTVFFLVILVPLVCFSCSRQPIDEVGIVEIVEIFGHTVRADAAEIIFSGDEIPGISELSANLKLLTKLEKVDLGGFHMFEEEMRGLSDEFPGVTFEYIIPAYPILHRYWTCLFWSGFGRYLYRFPRRI